MLWRQYVQRAWRAGRWPVIGGLWLLTLALGYAGFRSHCASEVGRSQFCQGPERTPLDLLYLAFQLFTLESGWAPGPKPWPLEVARFLAPMVAAYTAVQALAGLFFAQFQAWRLRRIRGHAVICGLGRKGYLLAQAFLEHGEQVVVIERDEEDDLLQPCRDAGALVVAGDATDPAVLCRAGIGRAAYLVATSGDDGANAGVAVRARSLVAGRSGPPLTCLVHIVDPHLWWLLREQEVRLEDAAFRLEFFNVYDMAARAVLKEHSPFDAPLSPQHWGGQNAQENPTLPAVGGPPHILIVGLGAMGRSLLVHAVREWRERQSVIPSGSDRQSPLHGQSSAESRLRVSIVDREADRKVATLRLRYPQLSRYCELIPWQMDVRWPEFERAEFLVSVEQIGSLSRRCVVTAVYVCLDNDSLGLTAGLSLLQKLRGQGVPVVVRMSGADGLAPLLTGTRAGEGFADLHAFGLLERVCRLDLLLGGTHETLARAIHEEYLRTQAAAGETLATNPALLPWDDLSERLKESNRRQADHVGAKLAAVGCDLVPLSDWDAEQFEFTEAEVELMARMEHERWVAEVLRGGWKFAPGLKNPERKTNPDLVPWNELPEIEKEKNRTPARGLPRFLAKAGLQVYRQKEKQP
jgi:hypothetical protein